MGTVTVPPAPTFPSPIPTPLPRLPLRDLPEPDEEFWSPTEVVEWRIWRWDGETLRGMREGWPRANHTARCSSCSEVPGWSHTCGIYAVKERSGLVAFGFGPIVGRVELSGMVIEHDRGYRATNARIVELWVDGSIDVTHAIKERYPEVVVHWDPDWNERSLV